MPFVQEILAIIALIVRYILESEFLGGDGPAKEKAAVDGVMSYLTTPGGFHVTSPRALDIWRFTVKGFIYVLVLILNHFGYLGNSGKSSAPPPKP